MAVDIGDYALIGDCQTAALISSRGSIDWLCWPRFDSEACLAALLDGESYGCWTMSPRDAVFSNERRYRPDTLILETRMATRDGAVRLIDFMPMRDVTSDIVRIVVGESGQVEMRTKLALRFDYGRRAHGSCKSAVIRSISSPDHTPSCSMPTGISSSGMGTAPLTSS
jgi:GH15 family glucan-1,4-alpha-glucosidase